MPCLAQFQWVRWMDRITASTTSPGRLWRSSTFTFNHCLLFRTPVCCTANLSQFTERVSSPQWLLPALRVWELPGHQSALMFKSNNCTYLYIYKLVSSFICCERVMAEVAYYLFYYVSYRELFVLRLSVGSRITSRNILFSVIKFSNYIFFL